MPAKTSKSQRPANEALFETTSGAGLMRAFGTPCTDRSLPGVNTERRLANGGVPTCKLRSR
jgi:hypothetical protein